MPCRDDRTSTSCSSRDRGKGSSDASSTSGLTLLQKVGPCSEWRACRDWLEETLLSLERRGVLDATREYRPPHYHIALYPSQYDAYVTRIAASADTRAQDVTRTAAASEAMDRSGDDTLRYRVRSGDSLWEIARSHGTTVDRLRLINNLSNSRIYAGQVIEVPAR